LKVFRNFIDAITGREEEIPVGGPETYSMKEIRHAVAVSLEHSLI
jgi:hypothetical protein